MCLRSGPKTLQTPPTCPLSRQASRHRAHQFDRQPIRVCKKGEQRAGERVHAHRLHRHVLRGQGLQVGVHVGHAQGQVAQATGLGARRARGERKTARSACRPATAGPACATAGRPGRLRSPPSGPAPRCKAPRAVIVAGDDGHMVHATELHRGAAHPSEPAMSSARDAPYSAGVALGSMTQQGIDAR